MKTNESTIDRGIRGILAAVAAVLAVTVVRPGSLPGVILLVAAAALGITAATGFCPVYQILGIDTCRLRR